jgi:peptidoglycan/LPS O-acetylase OafA/YrhL
MSPSVDEEQHSVLLEDRQRDAVSSTSKYLSFTEKSLGIELQYPQMSKKFQALLVRAAGNARKGLFPALIPSFLRPADDSEGKGRLHPTSWLVGLRGVASFFVWIHHFILVWFPALDSGYHSGPNSTSFFQLPFLRIVYSGQGMITIFFIISGYLLSHKALKQIRRKEFALFLDILCSATFGRALRLFLPVIAATFLTMLVHRWGWYTSAPTMPKMQASFWEQLKDWWWNFILLSNPTQGIDGNDINADPYGFQLWIIPREFRGSLLIYITLLGFAKCRQAVRLVLASSLTWFLFWIAQWDLGLFLAGMIIADVQLMTEDPGWGTALFSLSGFFPQWALRHKTSLVRGLTIFATLLAIHFLTFPDEGASSSPGYGYMIAITPDQYGGTNLTQRFWLCIGSVLIVLAICFSPAIGPTDPTPMLQKPFIIPFSQYLGDISYALYVTHPLILWTLGMKLLNFWKDKTATEYVFGFIEAIFINSFLCFWLADLFWRGVDAKSVRFAKWAAEACFIKL